MLCSNNIIRYRCRSSKGFARTQLINSRPAHPPFFTFLMYGFVYTACTVLASEGCGCTEQEPTIVATRYYSQNIEAPKVSPEHMSRSTVSTALEPEGCWCTH